MPPGRNRERRGDKSAQPRPLGRGCLEIVCSLGWKADNDIYAEHNVGPYLSDTAAQVNYVLACVPPFIRLKQDRSCRHSDADGASDGVRVRSGG